MYINLKDHHSPIRKGFAATAIRTHKGLFTSVRPCVCSQHPGMIELLVAINALELPAHSL